jgi:hypothetical protein
MYVQANFSYSIVNTHYLPCYLNRGSQEERITILKMAITEKGIIPGSHYDLQVAPIFEPQESQPNPSDTTTSESAIWL